MSTTVANLDTGAWIKQQDRMALQYKAFKICSTVFSLFQRTYACVKPFSPTDLTTASVFCTQGKLDFDFVFA